MSELRYYGFKIQVENEDGKTKVSQFRKAVSDLDDTVEMLNSSLGDNVKVTASTVQSSKEAAAQARLLTAQYEREKNKTKQVMDQYKNLTSTIQTYGNDLEVVNAVTRLGSNATEEQRQEIVRLVKEYQNLRNAGDANRSSFRQLRGAAQNFSWQLQDTIVQLQMGTNWITVLTQQGSQAAAIFGAWGAAIGAGIAIVGAALPPLLSTFIDLNDELDELEKKKLEEILKPETIAGNIDDLQSRLTKLNAQIAELKKGEIRDVYNAYGTLVVEERGEVDTEKLKEATNLEKARQEILKELLAEQKKLTPEWKAQQESIEQSIALGEVFNELLAEETENIKNKTKATIESQKADQAAADEMERLRKQYQAERDTIAQVIAGLKAKADGIGKTAAQQDVLTARVQYGNKATVDEMALIERYIRLAGERQAKVDADKEALEAHNKAVNESIKLAEQAAKARERLLSGYERQLKPDMTGNPVIDEETKHNKILRELQEERAGLQEDDYKNQIRIDALLEAETKRHKEAIGELQLSALQNNLTLVSSTASMLSSIVDEISDGGQSVKEAMAEMNDAQKTMFLVNRSILAAEALMNGMSLGVELAKNFGVYDPTTGLANSYVAFGTALGAAQAGAIMGTTFAGFFDEGGKIPAGKTGIVSEYQDELVNGVLVKGPANVVGSSDTARIMDSGMSAMNAVVNNYASGTRVTSRQLTTGDVEFTVRDILDRELDQRNETLMNNSNSRSSKSISRNYRTSRNYR